MSAFVISTAANPHRIAIEGTTFLVREPTVEEGLGLLSELEGEGSAAAMGAYRNAVRIGLVGWEGPDVPAFVKNDPAKNIRLLGAEAYMQIAQYVIDHATVTAEELGNSAARSASADPDLSAAEEDLNAQNASRASINGNSKTARSRRSART